MSDHSAKEKKTKQINFEKKTHFKQNTINYTLLWIPYKLKNKQELVPSPCFEKV